MKKHIFAALLFFAVFYISAQNFTQILMPQKVYIGDMAELRISFNSNLEIEEELFDKDNSITLDEDGFCDALPETDYVIKKITLQKTGVDFYNLILEFIPWKTGLINFPVYDVGKALKNRSFEIEIKPVSVMSILEQNSDVMRDFSSPLLLPGTTYKIWFCIILIVLLTVVLIRVIVSYKKIALKIENLKLYLIYRKNQKVTLKKIAKACSLEDKEFAEEVQMILRNYLEIRFSAPFLKKTTSEIPELFKDTVKNENENWNKGINQLTEIFKRTDMIRFGNESFTDGEKISIAESIRKITEIFGVAVTEVSEDEEKEEVNA